MSCKSDKNHVHIDRFEEDTAVLVHGEDVEFSIPRKLIPACAKEGDWLIMHMAVDEEKTAEKRNIIRDLRDRLGSDDDGGDIEL